MRYRIVHQTQYHYVEPVQLGLHLLRLQPRVDGSQRLHQFTCKVAPTPDKSTDWLDLEGNVCRQVQFVDTPIATLTITSQCDVETLRSNPFDYLSPDWAMTAPLDYPQSVQRLVAPYLTSPCTHSPAVIDWAQQQLHQVDGNVGLFLTGLTQTIYQTCTYETRHHGPPWPAGVVLAKQRGSCRDFAVLFMAACRAVGLAARFVSGYQRGDADQTTHELHAWPEVYIPGGGWRGFDPTLGLAVADGHIALAAAVEPTQAAPITGRLQSGYLGQSTLTANIRLNVVDS
ncbi:transglutaminase family protein [Leptolyngbyaceae cyanobacterium CCMR0082]|uniref:Transglutaminase family protein n=1 Tax=Adonisia turfae CCMR0082 TaxID=2304604 RepID=A0A6M0S8K7_9CYAN|nr:transglutaminase family protein [Leptothoe sp. LEGE 181152]NEZ64301.1 transglutaminase family protein [Adonisia turfae CCMR0082]